jgi:small ligand-binding sensory domain FIST
MPDEMKFASAITTERDIDRVVQSLEQDLRTQMDFPELDLVVVFFSSHWSTVASAITDRVRTALNPRFLIGCTCEGVIGKDREIERERAVSIVAARLPHATLVPFSFDSDDWTLLEEENAFRKLVGLPIETRLVVLLADPHSTPIDGMLDAFNMHYPGIPLVGGMASGGAQVGSNVLVLNDRAFMSGAVGVALAGDFDVDVIVSQGCRPFGRTFTVSDAEENILRGLEGTPTLEQVQKLVADLSEDDRALLKNGLFVGRAIRSGDLGRGDFLIRSVIGIDRSSGAMGVGDSIRTGETIQFHLRDQKTAEEDLEMLLMPQSLDEPPAGMLLFSCNGRGTRLYDHPNGDVSIVQDILGNVNLAGFFCAGEIGPIAGKNFLHGHTASIALFRPRSTYADS